MLTLESAIQKIQQFSPEQKEEVIKFIEFIDFKSHQAQFDTLANKPEGLQASFTEIAKEFIGCLDSDLEDLSQNLKYLERFGK
ncbi:hypothetical protein ACN4EE_16860 [Geminocystis sp. CENA526]|uniref:hypothetical protein n=1 Tax=Geminocystis sp. CENA526 TaxID=1355871 RepID=UPI003D6E59C7